MESDKLDIMSPVKGFDDLTEEQAIKQEKIRKIIVETFELYGFEPAETPVIEFESFVKGNNSNDKAVSDIFKLKDKGDRNLALRYEFTFQLKRISKNKKLPYKRYQIGPVFRDEPITGNRFRQFTQCDIDVVGSTIRDEAEILSIAKKTLNKIGIKPVIYVNNRRLLNEILGSQGIKESDRELVIREIDKIDKLPESQVKENLKKFKAENLLKSFRESENYFKKFQSYKEIEELKKLCKFYDVDVVFLPSLARGLSYYNGNIFEIKSSLRESICGGGSYEVDGVSATGISFGLERLRTLAKIQVGSSKAVIISINQDEKTIKLAEDLRENKISCIILSKGISKSLDYANSKKIPYAIIIGEDEIKSKKYKLKDMSSGKEQKLNLKSIIKKLQRI